MPGIHFSFPPEGEFIRGFQRIREEFEVSVDFPPQVEAAARLAADTAVGADRRDLRDVPFVAIDPPGSRDLDQAFYATSSSSGYRVRYAIADVSHFVEPGDPVDVESRRRGVTFYAPDSKAPLHPLVLSAGAASLLPDVDRPAIVWTHDLDTHGNLVDTHVERAIVRNRAMLTYGDVDADLSGGDPNETHLLLREIGIARQRQEQTRGGISLRIPNQEVVHDGATYRLMFRRTMPVENWNAQMSLLTGMAAAQLMIDARVGLLRTLPKPQKRTLAWLRRCSRAMDVSYPDYLAYPDWVRSLDTKNPDHAALMTQAARAFRGAGYVGFDGEVPDDTGHGAIAADYAHVTAPLRRLIDRFGNEIVLSIARSERPPTWVVDSLDTLPAVMVDAARRERAFERAILDFTEALILADRVGEVFEAVATDVDDGRVTVQIRRPAIVARFDTEGVELGDEIHVRLVDADPSTRRVDFEIV